MSVPESVQVKILSTPEFVQELKNEAKANPDKIEVLSSGPERDPTCLEFGLAEVAYIACIIQTAFFIGDFCYRIFNNKDKAKLVAVLTPLRREEIALSEDLTTDEIKNILNRSIGIVSRLQKHSNKTTVDLPRNS